MNIPARFAPSVFALALLLGLGSTAAGADPNGPKDVRLMSPEEGDVFHVGDEIVVEGKSRGNPSPTALVFCRIFFSTGRLTGVTNPIHNKWSITFIAPIPSPAVVQVIYLDDAKDIVEVFERPISILP